MKKVVEVHKDSIVVGDTIMILGIRYTVCQRDIKHNQLTGRTIFGNSYKLGQELVKKVVWIH